jgi:hypothetical protein
MTTQAADAINNVLCKAWISKLVMTEVIYKC